MTARWQQGKPTQPGYYWLHRPFLEGPYIDKVEYFGEALVTVYDGVATTIEMQNITRYAGPLVAPEYE